MLSIHSEGNRRHCSSVVILGVLSRDRFHLIAGKTSGLASSSVQQPEKQTIAKAKLDNMSSI